MKAIFTEEEKNEIVAECVEEFIYNDGEMTCPIPRHMKTGNGCFESGDFFCRRIFAKTDRCPCSQYSEKYVKQKFWTAMD